MTSIMQGITGVVSWIFDLLMAPFASLPAVGMIVISAITAVWALLLFKAVTPQEKLTATRDKLFGHIYEMGLYQDHLGVLARIQGDLAKANFRYLGFTLPALVALTIPMVLTLGQLEGRYTQRPLQVGESTVLTISVEGDVGAVRLQAPGGVKVAAGPVRNRRTGTLAWRLEAVADGTHELRFLNGDKLLGSHKLFVGPGLPRLHDKSEKSAMGILLYPGAPDLSDSKGLKSLSIQWPERSTSYLGLKMNWLVAFIVFSMIAGLLIKDWLKVSL